MERLTSCMTAPLVFERTARRTASHLAPLQDLLQLTMLTSGEQENDDDNEKASEIAGGCRDVVPGACAGGCVLEGLML